MTSWLGATRRARSPSPTRREGVRSRRTLALHLHVRDERLRAQGSARRGAVLLPGAQVEPRHLWPRAAELHGHVARCPVAHQAVKGLSLIHI
eukprot:8210485-Alexandrium_andersonii.AAC.1